MDLSRILEAPQRKLLVIAVDGTAKRQEESCSGDIFTGGIP